VLVPTDHFEEVDETRGLSGDSPDEYEVP
jgi:hypothetical protein